PVTNYQVQDFRIWRTALSETFLNEYFTKSLTNKEISVDTLSKYKLFYWLPSSNSNNERRTTRNINSSVASTSTGDLISPINFGISGELTQPSALYNGNTPQSGTSFPLLQYDSNTSYNSVGFSSSLQPGKRFYVTHRTLNVGENVLYQLLNTDGTVNTSWTSMSVFSNKANDKYANLPTNFYNGIIQTCISNVGSFTQCNSEPQTIDTIRTVADAPIINYTIAQDRKVTINFTSRDSGFSPIKRYIVYTSTGPLTGVKQTTVTAMPGVSTYTTSISGLDTANIYTIKVVAVNNGGINGVEATSDTAFSLPIRITDSTLLNVNFCQNLAYLKIRPKFTNANYIIRATATDLTSLADLTGIISRANLDTIIQVPNLNIGKTYRFTLYLYNNATNSTIYTNQPTSINNGQTLLTTIDTTGYYIDTFRFNGITLITDTICSNQSISINLNSKISGGRNKNATSTQGNDLYSYRWYANNIANNTNGWQTTNSNFNQRQYNVRVDSSNTRFYYAAIRDSLNITLNGTTVNVCATSTPVFSPLVARYTNFLTPILDTSYGFTLGDTICQAADTFRTLIVMPSTNPQALGFNSFSYKWYVKSLSISNTGVQLRDANGSSYKPRNDTFYQLDPVNNTFPVNFYYYVEVQNGPRASCNTVSSESKPFWLIANPSAPTNLSVQEFGFNNMDSFNYLRPSAVVRSYPSYSIRWYSRDTVVPISSTGKIFNDSNYYVVNYRIENSLNNYTCETYPRFKVRAIVYEGPSPQNRPIVTLRNTLNTNKTVMKIYVPLGENILRSADSPNYYTIIARDQITGVETRIDSFYRFGANRSGVSGKVDSFFGASAAGLYYNLHDLGLTNRVPYYIYFRASNRNGTSPNSPLAINSLGDSIFSIFNNAVVNYRSTSYAQTTTNVTDTFSLPSIADNWTAPCVIEVWFKSSKTPDQLALANPQNTTNDNIQRIFDFGDGSVNTSASVLMLGFDKNNLYYRSDSSSLHSVNIASFASIQNANFNLANWNHYALVLEDTGVKRLKLYVNGSLVAFDTGKSIKNLNFYNYLGKTGYNAAARQSPTTNGEFREFRLWKQNRSPLLIRSFMMRSVLSELSNVNLIMYHPLGNANNERLHSYNISNNTLLQSKYLNLGQSITIKNNNNTSETIWKYDSNKTAYLGKYFNITHRTLNTQEFVMFSIDNGLTWSVAQNFAIFGLDNQAFPMGDFKNGPIKVRIYTSSTGTAPVIDNTNINNYIDTFPDYLVTTIPATPVINRWNANRTTVNLNFNSITDSGYSSLMGISVIGSGVDSQGNVRVLPTTNFNISSNNNYNFTISSPNDTGRTYSLRYYSRNNLGNSDTSTAVVNLRVFDSATLNINACEFRPVLTIQTRQNNINYIIQPISTSGASTVSPIIGTIQQAYRDTNIVLNVNSNLLTVGQNYRYRVTLYNGSFDNSNTNATDLSQTVQNGISYTVSNDFTPRMIDTIKITTTPYSVVDTFCNSISFTPTNIIVLANGGRVPSANNSSGGSATYSYQWYTSGTTNLAFFNQATPISSANSTSKTNTLTPPKDTSGLRYYWVEIKDSIDFPTTLRSVCAVYPGRVSQVLGQITSYLLPDTSRIASSSDSGYSSAWYTGDTACRLNTTPFKTLKITITSLTRANSNINYQWFVKRIGSGGSTGGTLIQSGSLGLFPSLSYTPPVDSPANSTNPNPGLNYYYVILQNGSRNICRTISQLSGNFQLIDTTNFTSPTVTNFNQLFNFSINDSLRFLVPTPSSSIIYYNALTGGSPFATPVSPFNTTPFSGWKLKTDSTYYVVNRITNTGRTCESFPRKGILVRVNRIPLEPIRPTVTLQNNSANQTIATVKVSGEQLTSDKLDSPNTYYVVAVTFNYVGAVGALNASRTVLVDTAIRGSTKFNSLFGSGLPINLSTSGPLGSNGLLNKERFFIFLRAENTAGNRTSKSAFNASGTDSAFFISPLLLNSFRTTSWDSRSPKTPNVTAPTATAPNGDPVSINYIKLPQLDLTNTNYTIEFWAKFDNNIQSDWARIFDFNTAPNSGTGVVFGLPISGTQRFGFHSNSSDFLSTATYTSFLNGGNGTDWHHYALVLNCPAAATNGVMTLFIDGVVATSDATQKWITTNLLLNYIARPTFAGPGTNLQMQDFRIWKTARTEQQINEYFTKNLATPGLSLPNLYYWLPFGNTNQERRSSTVLNLNTTAPTTTILPSTLGNLNGVSNAASVYYTRLDTPARIPSQLFYDSNNAIVTNLAFGKKLYITHRTLNSGETILYRLINPDGSFAAGNSNYTTAQSFANRPTDKLVPIPSTLNSNNGFYSGVVEYCVSTNGTSCSSEIRFDSLRTVPDAPTITSVRGRNKSGIVNFTRNDSGFSSITQFNIIATPVSTGTTRTATLVPTPGSGPNYSGIVTNLDSGINYRFRVVAINNNGLWVSDTSVYSSPVKIFDSATITSLIFCEDSFFLTLNPKDSGLYYSIVRTQLNGSGAGVPTIPLGTWGQIRQRSKDTLIRYKFEPQAIGNSYSFTIYFSKNNGDTTSNTSYYTSSRSAGPFLIDTIRIRNSVLIQDTFCTSIANIPAGDILTVNAFGGRLQDS
ncbi:MAG: hypothetical protein ORN85_09780, partial [Sediminibacterium sp.]|nr:hypothetical protein [Sediminibacterium sp.]